ncbi:MAG: hypothetical protein F6K41_43665, partial [Symploca sp. SIO3E6]|nr:hypothetical protein [Caldora sp. SIO3E6]
GGRRQEAGGRRQEAEPTPSPSQHIAKAIRRTPNAANLPINLFPSALCPLPSAFCYTIILKNRLKE